MRPLEIALWVATIPVLLWCLSHRGLAGWVRVTTAVALVLMIVHLALEGWRWHLGPTYLIIPYLFIACVWPGVPRLQPGVGAVLVGIGLMAATVALTTAFPVFDLPRPSGHYPIGTVALHLVDPARQEPRTDRSDGRRELMVQIWYPAEQVGPGQPYRQRAETTFLSRHLSLARTHAAARVPVAGDPGRFPVVVFAPSWGGCRTDNTIQAEELASHGFIVVGVDHPYSSDRVAFPDGRVALSTLTEFLDYASDGSLAATERVAEEELRTRAADVRFVLDELERLDRSDPNGLLVGRLDTSRVGLFGHSFGGAVSAEVCRADPRAAAGVDLDGLIFGEVRRAGFGKPFLYFSDDTRIPSAAEIDSLKPAGRRRWTYVVENVHCIRSGLARVGGHYAVLRGARHADFCDSPSYSPFHWLRPVNDSPTGPIRHDRAMEILNAYLLSFFRKHLKGEDDGLLDSPTPYREVEIERLTNDNR